MAVTVWTVTARGTLGNKPGIYKVSVEFGYLGKVLVFTATATAPVSVEHDPSAIPTDYQLFDAYPNPFNPSTTIRFGLPERSTVKLRLYNTLGTLVDELMEGERDAGQYSFRWAPRNTASGVYLIRLEAQSSTSTRRYTSSRKVILLK